MHTHPFHAYKVILPVSGAVWVESGAAAKSLPPTEKDVLVKRLWGPIAEQAKTRKELKELGARKIVHTQGTWQERMQREIDQRLAS